MISESKDDIGIYFQGRESVMKRCIRCGRGIQDNAQNCPYCGSAQYAVMYPAGRQQSQNHAGRFCPQCGRRLEQESRFCPGCGATLNGGSGSGNSGGNVKTSNVLMIVCLVAAFIYASRAMSYVGYLSYYRISDRIWGFLMFAVGIWNVFILALIGTKCDRRYGRSMLCALTGGSVLKILLHIINLFRLSGTYSVLAVGFGVMDILAIIVLAVVTTVIWYLMKKDGMLDSGYGETLEQAIKNIPWALKQMTGLKVNGKASAGSGNEGFYGATPAGKLRIVFLNETFLIFLIVYTLDLVFQIYSGFALLSIGFHVLPILVCIGLWLIFYSSNWKDKIDENGFFLMNITLTVEFAGSIVLAVVLGILLLIATIGVGAYMLIADLIVAVYLGLSIYFWWTLKKTVNSMRGIVRGTETRVYSSVFPIVILGMQVAYKVIMFIGACIMQIVAGSVNYTINQYGNEIINEFLGDLGIGYMGVGYTNTADVTSKIFEPINSWIQGIFGFSQSPLVMLIGVAVPVLEIMMLLKIRSYSKEN